MAEEVVKTIENVDKLFSEIVVNGEVHKSNRYTSPSVQSASPSSVRSTQGEDVHAVELNDVLHNFSDPDIDLDVQALQQGLANETSARTTTDQALDSAIAQEANTRSSADEVLQTNINTVSGNVSTLQGKVSTIESEIPSQASSSNQLADKNFVNSSISTNTANFLGTYTSLADIEAIQNPTNNDYAFLQTTDSAGNNLFDRYKYNADQGEWLFEYELNNSSFTAEQWATINSGLTSSSVSDAIGALDVPQAGGAGKYIESISQVDGKIVVTEKTFAVALLDIAHPVGSLYWTSSSENPAVTFGGGTWKQIKDVFVWAKGDSDTVNTTGGSKTVTLTTNQIPSHTHSVTASGTISVTTNPTFTGTAVTSGANNRGHTHNFEHKHTTGGMSANSSGYFTTRVLTTDTQFFLSRSGCVSAISMPTDSTNYSMINLSSNSSRATAKIEFNVSHTHTTNSLTNASGTAITNTGSESQNHTHSVTAEGTVSGGAYKFTGSAVTSGGAGGGQAHDNMPPYVVKYCWERTA